MYGVIIEKGSMDWQIIQQKDGFGILKLEGVVNILDDEWALCSDHRVMVRVLLEETESRVFDPFFIPVSKENNHWSIEIKLPAGGLYRIETLLRLNQNWEKRGDRILHLGVGDIYVITGQSNAVGVGRDLIHDPMSDMVHMFRANGRWEIAANPTNDGTNTLYPDILDGAAVGHSPWLTFGKILSKNLGYPIGFIPAAKGGVPLMYWDKAQNGFLFDNMVNMVNAAGGSVKGVIWYQGCNDAVAEEKRKDYLAGFKRFYRDLERVFYKDIPLISFQLNKATCVKDDDVTEVGRNYAVIREAQRQAALQIKNVHLIATLDLPVCDGIHNSGMSVLVLGQRAADTALKYIYGKDRVCDAPQINKIVRSGEDSVVLHFDNVYEMLFSDLNSTDTLMFTVTDEEGRAFPIDYECKNNNQVWVRFDRKIGRNATVSCDRYNPTNLIIYDMFSYLPIIAFADVRVEE